MNTIVVNYVQLICITLFMRNNVNCDQLMSQVEEEQTFKVSTCTAYCLETSQKNTFRECYDFCNSNEMESKLQPRVVHDQTKFTFHLFCRDSARLAIEFSSLSKEDISHVVDQSNETFIYLIVLQESQASFMDRKVYLSDEYYVSMENLTAQTSYNISAMIISSRNVVYNLGTRTYTTLKVDFQPEDITDIKLVNFELIYKSDRIGVLFKWEPARDETCKYEIIIHDPKSYLYEDEAETLHVKRKNYPDIYHHYMEIGFESEISMAVRGINEFKIDNKYIEQKESEVSWAEFKIPTCMEFYHNRSICDKPEGIVNLYSNSTNVGYYLYNIRVFWKKPLYNPDFYTLEIIDMFSNRPDFTNTENLIHTYQINETETSFEVRNLKLSGISYLVKLKAHLNNVTIEDYNTFDVTPNIFKKKQNWTIPMVILIIASIITIIMVSILIYNQYQFKEKLNENMDLDLIKSITNRSVLEAIDELTKDELMEIDRDNITILEALGEGAFGYVKKGIVIKNDVKLEVAVKMLKNSSNLEDIKEFHREIAVMKSVGQHENIVSIIGHCTSNIEELMLLIEYCEAGNLLELLRNEFSKQLKVYSYNNSICDKRNDYNSEDEGNFSCPSKFFVVNKMYDELNNNQNNGQVHTTALKAIEITNTATNAMYFNFIQRESQHTTIEIPTLNEEIADELLSSYDLISYSKQICDGMSFLEKKKVVHRDLAARNILVCSSRRHVKIADFGLSRDIYQENMYRKTGGGKLPLKWLAIESMTHQVYTSQSDVWSFGILLFEIVSLGAAPYPSISADQLVKKLSNGYRLEKPFHCHSSLYDVMHSCWHINPQARPSFDELSAKLQNFLIKEKSSDINFIELAKLFAKCSDETNYMKPNAR